MKLECQINFFLYKSGMLLLFIYSNLTFCNLLQDFSHSFIYFALGLLEVQTVAVWRIIISWKFFFHSKLMIIIIWSRSEKIYYNQWYRVTSLITFNKNNFDMVGTHIVENFFCFITSGHSFSWHKISTTLKGGEHINGFHS